MSWVTRARARELAATPWDDLARRGNSWLRLILGTSAALSFLVAALGVLSYMDTIRATERLNTGDFWEFKGIGYYEQRHSIIAPFVLMAKDSFRVRAGEIDMACDQEPNDVARTAGACALAGSHLYLSSPSASDVRTEGDPYIASYAIRLHPYAIIGSLVLALLLAMLARARTLPEVAGIVGAALAMVGIALLAVNTFGLTQSLRHPDVHNARGMLHPIDVTIDYETALGLLEAKNDGDVAGYVRQATFAVADGVLHRWDDEQFDKLRIRVPVWENWILHLLGLIDPELREYIFWDHRRGLERGVGLCGHVSSILVGFLREKGLDARTVALFGHMVVTAEVEDGEWYLLDPDYGVVIPRGLDQVVKDPEIVEAAYSERLERTALSGAKQAEIVDRVLGFYSHTESNIIDATGRLGYYSGMASPAEWYGEREALTYALIWPVPLALLGSGALLMVFWRWKSVDRS